MGQTAAVNTASARSSHGSPHRSPVVPRAARAVATTAGVSLGLGAAAFAWGAGYEVRAPRLRRVQVPVLPAGQRPLRVLHLSDLHLTPAQERMQRWIAALGDLEPDLVVDTGDNLAHRDAVPVVLRSLGRLLDRTGVFVLGSNDRHAPLPKNPFGYFVGPSRLAPGRELLPVDDLVSGLVGRGWTDLDNARTTLEVDGRRIDLVGVDDPHIGLDRYDDVRAPADCDADLTLGVAHAPYHRVLDAMTSDGVQVVIAGHTHGGQVCLPGVGALVTNCDIPRRCAKGLHRWSAGAGPVAADEDGVPPAGEGGPAWLHVSAGLGTSPYARVRFACPPEATLLTLVARDA